MATFYVTQAGTSPYNGNEDAPWSMAMLNNAANWGSGATQLGVGDTALLKGTLTSTLTTRGAGSAVAPVSIVFDTGAKFSAAHWNDGTVIAIGHNYILIDGGTNGVIESTANGDGLANQRDDVAVGNIASRTAISNIEIKNLTINNLYQRTQYLGILSSHDYGGGLWFANASNLNFHHNTLSQAGYRGIALTSYSGSALSTILFHHNTISGSAWNMPVTTVGPVIDNIQFYNNDISGSGIWDTSLVDDSNGHFHIDGPMIFGSSTGDTPLLTNAKVYNNYIHGSLVTMGNYVSGWINLGYSCYNAQVYNNLLVGDTINFFWARANSATQNMGHRYYNNTVIHVGSDLTGRFLRYDNGATGGYIYNNIGVDLGYIAAGPGSGDASLDGADYNDWYNCAGRGADSGTHTVTTNPNLDASYKATSTTPTGTNLSAYFTTDKDGNTRSIWNRGAYEYGAGSPPTGTITLSVR